MRDKLSIFDKGANGLITVENFRQKLAEEAEFLKRQLHEVRTPAEKCELLEEIKNLNAIYRLYEMLERKGGGSETD